MNKYFTVTDFTSLSGTADCINNAIDKIIRDTRDGLFDPAVVRGLLQTISLFPVGSYIAIGDDLIGRVLRSNPETYDRPIVEVWPRHKLNADPYLIDFSERDPTPLRPILPPRHD